jgi:diguanylate cyclase (GGDEF)-like protein
MTSSTLHDAVLRWSNELLQASTLEAFAEVIARPPAAEGPAVAANLVLLDSRHELRHLSAGDTDPAPLSPALRYVEGLGRVAPNYDLLQKPWSGVYHAADHGLLFDAAAGPTHLLLLPLPRGRAVSGVYNIAGCGGLPGLATLEPEWVEHVAGQVVATAERLFQRARLLRSGVVDPLTGWNSRHYMLARLREEVARSQRSGQAATCMIVDVDRLQAVNEHHGISAGDNALVELGARIESQVRASDAAAHLGSDSFALLLPETSPIEARPLAERILAAVRSAPVAIAPGVALPLTVSIGIAGTGMAPEDDRKAAANQWLAEAEAALHGAKRDGGDRWLISRGDATAAAGK